MVSAIVVGYSARAVAESRFVMRAEGTGTVPGLVGLMKETPLLEVLNSEVFLVRARCPISVVYDVMVIMFVSMAS